MNYTEAVRWLYSLTRIGIKPGLEVTRRLASLAGDPHAKLGFIHVAGTNGKGSVCAFLESIYRRTGLRVGLFTSPHLISFRERVQINREPIPEADVVRLLTRLRALAEADGLQPTFFEYVTVMALGWFAERDCDLVVLETGMGGRLDSTNIVTPLVSVITDIGIDHAAFLGDTLEAIAGEKAGIIKAGVPVVAIAQRTEAMGVIRDRAESVGAPLMVVDSEQEQGSVQENENSHFLGLTPSLRNGYRRRNARLAGGVVEVLNEASILPRISDVTLRDGLESASWPGRLQVIRRDAKTWLLDGAHNEDGLRALAAVVLEFAPVGGRTLILGILGDKPVAGAVAVIGEAFDRVLLTPVKSVRAGDPLAQLEAFRKAGVTAELAADLATAMKSVDTEFAVIAGSFYLVGEALELLDAVPAGLRSERELNEYGR